MYMWPLLGEVAMLTSSLFCRCGRRVGITQLSGFAILPRLDHMRSGARNMGLVLWDCIRELEWSWKYLLATYFKQSRKRFLHEFHLDGKVHEPPFPSKACSLCSGFLNYCAFFSPSSGVLLIWLFQVSIWLLFFL